MSPSRSFVLTLSSAPSTQQQVRDRRAHARARAHRPKCGRFWRFVHADLSPPPPLLRAVPRRLGPLVPRPHPWRSVDKWTLPKSNLSPRVPLRPSALRETARFRAGGGPSVPRAPADPSGDDMEFGFSGCSVRGHSIARPHRGRPGRGDLPSSRGEMEHAATVRALRLACSLASRFMGRG